MPDNTEGAALTTTAAGVVTRPDDPVDLEHLAAKVARRREVLRGMPAQLERLKRLGRDAEAADLQARSEDLRRQGAEWEEQLQIRYAALTAALNPAAEPQE